MFVGLLLVAVYIYSRVFVPKIFFISNGVRFFGATKRETNSGTEAAKDVDQLNAYCNALTCKKRQLSDNLYFRDENILLFLSLLLSFFYFMVVVLVETRE